ncbi:hypothetical protein QDY71_00585 [Kingella negevensis]|uniref:hypothetical protein n=1 Tax=Kingella negevensis TaxID=1522312 RepID=UPI0025511827|nr:hypothetical protein [Kingella negevensis]MDK4684562.1 hypothetical protein [Kingella negevensis]MDK4696293.1 hypothetical protein [Kingella negevensis]MDK4707690.1 hypothetical protein [Kingella negevensis]MDK4709874.1 hypothetical protein [Kingella negevensis]
MTTATISSQSDIQLGQDLLAYFGLQIGQRVDIQKLPNGSLVIQPVKSAPKGSIERLIGIHKGAAIKPLSIDEMNDLVADSWAK